MTRTVTAPLGLRPMRAILLGSVFTGLFSASAMAETLTVTDIEWPESPLYSVTIPSIEIVDGNLDEAAVRAMFSGEPQAFAPLATLDAASVSIPEITISATAEGEESGLVTYTYRNLKFTDVADGVAGSGEVGTTEFSSIPALTGTFGLMTVKDFDIGGLLGFYGLAGTPGTGDEELKQIYSDFTMEGGTLGAEGLFSCTLGGAEAGGFSARPLRYDMTQLQTLVTEAEAAQTSGEEFPPEKVKELVLFYTDLFTAFSSTPMSFDGFDCSGTDENGKPMTIAAGTMSSGAFEPGIYPDMAINDLTFDMGEEGHFNLGNFTWKKMDFNAAIDVLEAAVTMDEAFFTTNWRKLIPVMDGFSLAGLDFDVPNPEQAGTRAVGSLGSLDATLGNYVNGLPADIAFSVANLVVPLTDDMTDLPIADLKARGITSIDLSLGTDLNWDEATSTIEVSDVMIDMGPLGRINMSGTFGNATSALFSDNPDEAMMAALMITLKDVTLDIEDRGMGAMIVESAAKEAGQPEAAFRTAMAGMAQGMTMAFLGNSDEALTAAQQLGIFLQGASNLTMTVTAVDEAGLSLAEIAAAETDPTALAGKISVTAAASGEPVTLPLVESETSVQDQKRDLKAPATN